IGNDTQLRMLMTVVARPGVAPELLVVAESLEPLQRILRQTLVVLVVCGVLGIAAAVGGTILVTRQTFAPILQVTETAHEVAETHDYQRRISVPPQDDEVGQLATTINRLIATVDATLAQQQQLLADTSHELRSPLTAILANLALLQRDLAPEERVLSVTEATAEAQRMRRLITDLLLLSQPATPEVVDRRPVALETILTPLVLSLSRQWPTYALTYVMSPEAWVVGDAERLAQVLRNVLENAIYHTPPGTTIHVQLDQAAADVVVTVADSGPGIAAEHLPKIWHRLYRVDKARSRRHGGTGLGLAIVQYLMAAHGGEVSVDSTVGQGTTVMLRFPRQQRARAGEQPAACVCNVATIRQPAADVQRNDPE
ncbi:MAG TPA: HAMP domain-containing sensor histidine kinase, partial [Herpetosiphonaceae bacterium]